MYVYASLSDLVSQKILPLQKSHPQPIRLGDGKAGDNRRIFAVFQWEGKNWRVNSDTRLEAILEAFKLVTTGNEPFMVSKTPKGTVRLLLSNQQNQKPNGLYIYKTGK